MCFCVVSSGRAKRDRGGGGREVCNARREMWESVSGWLTSCALCCVLVLWERGLASAHATQRNMIAPLFFWDVIMCTPPSESGMERETQGVSESKIKKNSAKKSCVLNWTNATHQNRRAPPSNGTKRPAFVGERRDLTPAADALPHDAGTS